MWRFIWRLGVLALLIYGGMQAWEYFSIPPEPDTPVSVTKDEPKLIPLDIDLTLKQPEGVTQVSCQSGTCRTNPVAHNSVTDGEWQYFYEEGERDKVFLKRRHIEGGEEEVIMESTPLTSPRDLSLSPNGELLAFWLDNIGNKREQLTEVWLYNTKNKSIRLAAEKIFTPDVHSDLFWNSASSQIYFVADIGEQKTKDDELALIIIDPHIPGKAAAFPNIDWASYPAKPFAYDISLSGENMAYATSGLFVSHLVISNQDGSASQKTSVRGDIAYIQWLSSDTLIYAVQDKTGVTFWQQTRGLNRFVARRPGSLQASRTDTSGQYAVFAISDDFQTYLYQLHLESGLIGEEAKLPVGDSISINHISESRISPELEGRITSNADDELVAFVEDNFAEISSSPTAQPTRIDMTSEPNTLFLTWAETGDNQRILLSIIDTFHKEWVIKAYYEQRGVEWVKTQGSSLPDPEIVRLYEWEEEVTQWIQKPL